MTPHQETPPPPPLTDSAPSTGSPITEPSDQSEDAVESCDVVEKATDENLEEEGVSDEKVSDEKGKVLTPYGLPCVRELLRFLVSIINTEEG